MDTRICLMFLLRSCFPVILCQSISIVPKTIIAPVNTSITFTCSTNSDWKVCSLEDTSTGDSTSTAVFLNISIGCIIFYVLDGFSASCISTYPMNVSFTIHNIRNDHHNSTVKCQVTDNSDQITGQSTSTIYITNAPDTRPVITETPPGPIVSGDKKTLICSVSGGYPLAVLSFNCSGHYNNHTSGNTASYSVEFTVNKTDNNRICTCSGSHTVPSYRPTVHHRLVVYYAPDTMPVVRQSPLGVIIDGSELTLTCAVQGGNPLPILQWNCSGTSVNNTSGDIASYSIVFIVDKNYNNKICSCSATHPVISYQPSLLHRLVVYYAPDTTPVITKIPEGEIVSDEKVTLTCLVSGGNPLAVLSWNCSGNNNNNTSGNTASYSVEFTVDKTYNNRVCTCSGSHIVQSYRPTVHQRLVVYYTPDTKPIIEQLPPDHVINGRNVTLKCYVSGGNPLATLTWDCSGNSINSTSGNTAFYTVEFTAYKADNNKICTCAATHPVTSYNQAIQHKLNVYYAPDVTVDAEPNDFLEGEELRLICKSSGNPSVYNYQRWIHTYGGTTIRHFDAKTSNLTLKSLSYQDIGDYICAVSNNVPNLEGSLFQHGTKNVEVKFKPVFVDVARIISAKEGSSVSAFADIFAFPDIDKPLQWKNQSGNTLRNDTNVGMTYQLKSLNISFHNIPVSINKYTYRSAIHFNNFERYFNGFYTLIANNDVGGANVTLRIVSSDKPDAPSNFTARVVESTSVTLSWIRGFNGGNTQSFTITYKKQNTNTVLVLVKEEEWDVNEYEQEIVNLVPSTAYSFSIIASNIEGNTHAKNILIIKTSDRPVLTESSKGHALFATGISLSVISLLAISIVVIWIACWRFRMKKKKSKCPENYTEFTTKSNTVTDTYDVINQTTDIDKSRNPSEENERSANTYEDCQPYNSPDIDYYNMKQKPKGSKLTKAADYANLKF